MRDNDKGPALYVKYCGGCNPTYDRVALAGKTGCLLGAQLVYSAPASAQYRLVVCGCLRACVHLPAGLSHVVCTGESAEKLAQQLKATDDNV